MRHSFPRCAFALVLACFAPAACAGNISYLSSSGHMLHNSGGSAVTADWRGQPPLEGFTGRGQIRLNGQCLGGKDKQQLRWEACRTADKSQNWILDGGKLSNELGWCADVEGGRDATGVRVLAWKCTGLPNQKWKTHQIVEAHSVAARISDASVSRTFLETVRVALPGEIISITTGRVIAPGSPDVVAEGGATVIAAGGGNVIAAGAMN